MNDSTGLRVTREWEVYSWIAICVLMLLYLLVDLINLEMLQPLLIIPAIVLFLAVVIPNLIRASGKSAH